MCSKKHTSQVLLPTHKNGWAYILIYQNPIYDWYPWVSQKPETESSIASLELIVSLRISNGPVFGSFKDQKRDRTRTAM
ncbi:hypothetical protein B0H10DRAFT_1370467 [Mycena sp. CBHHK59/15]|nr:hypothetical protein B0H10DRAFT_1370467 [Mycena sp. CBHHK59/15]